VEPDPLTRYGGDDHWTALFACDPASNEVGAALGRVIRHDGVALLVATAHGVRSLPWRRTIEPAPLVGDWVVTMPDVVVSVLPRTGVLRRRDPRSALEQPLAANVDTVLITCGLDRPVRLGRIQRAVSLAWDAEAVPLVVLTKADLRPDAPAVAREIVDAATGADVVLTSATTGIGIVELRQRLACQTAVLLGESGAGKSTLANALIGEEVAAIGGVRAGDAKGRHTTTSRRLHPLPGGGVLIDTPGIRQVGLWIDADAVDATFEDIDELATTCRFSDCAHAGEPGCAVAAAVAAGEVVAERVAAWQRLREEAQAAGHQAAEQARRADDGRSGAVRDTARRKGRTPRHGRPA
jgi:ribosome biogenesis GTPase